MSSSGVANENAGQKGGTIRQILGHPTRPGFGNCRHASKPGRQAGKDKGAVDAQPTAHFRESTFHGRNGADARLRSSWDIATSALLKKSTAIGRTRIIRVGGGAGIALLCKRDKRRMKSLKCLYEVSITCANVG